MSDFRIKFFWPLFGLLLIFLWSFFLYAQENPQENGNRNYLIARSYLLQGNQAKAKEYLQKAAATPGKLADQARFDLIRVVAMEKRKKGDSRLPQIRQILQQIKTRNMLGPAWMRAMRSLYDYGETEPALELALDASQRFDRKKTGYAAAIFAAELLFEKKLYIAALNLLVDVRKNDPEGEYADDAYYYIARIYITPGELYNPGRAHEALQKFTNMIKDKDQTFVGSIWRDDVERMLLELSGRQ